MALNASHLCPQAYNQTRDFMMRAFDLTEDQAITAITALVDFSITQVVDGNYGTNIGLSVFCAPLSACRRAVHSGQSTLWSLNCTHFSNSRTVMTRTLLSSGSSRVLGSLFCRRLQLLPQAARCVV